MFAGWSLWLLALAAWGLVFWSYSGRRLQGRLTEGLRRLLWMLRAAFLLALVALMTSPRVQRSFEQPSSAHLAVLVDDSESMNLPLQSDSPSGPTRAQWVESALEEKSIRDLSDRHLSVSLWRTSDLAPLQPGRAHPATASSSPLGEALAGLRNKFQEGRLEAIVLMTDGQNTQGPSPAQIGSQLGVPVYPVGLGSPESGWELAIEELNVPEKAFQDEAVPIQAIIGQRGVSTDATMEIKLTLTLDDRPVTEETLALAPGQTRLIWREERIFTESGQYRVEARIEPHGSDSIRIPLGSVQAQLRKKTNLAILRNRYSVVLFSGSPSWEFKYLRRALEEDPRLDVLALWPKPDGTLAVAAPIGNPPQGPMELLITALRRSPDRATLLKSLASVDLLILGDLKTQPLTRQNPSLLREDYQTISDWITARGGNLMLLGGPEMFGSSGPGFEPLRELAPVQFSDSADFSTQPVFLQLTEAGHRSEGLIALRQTGLDSLGPLLTHHRFGPLRMGAEVLLVTRQGAPLIAWQSAGSGRVMALGSSSFWMYGLPLTETRVPPVFLGGFWRDLARFLILGRQASGLHLFTDGQKYHRNEPVRVWASISEGLLGEKPPARLPLKLTSPGEQSQQTLFLSLRPDIPGHYEGDFRPQQAGTYEMVIEAGSLQETRRIEVLAAQEEYRRLNQNVELLIEVAAKSGGRYLVPEEFSRFADILKYRPRMETVTRSVFLGSLPWVLPLLIALVTIEWVIRKRHSLP